MSRASDERQESVGVGVPVRRQLSIGHTIWSLRDGGMERGLLNVVNLGNPAEFRHVILCLGEAGPLASRVTAATCRVVELRKRPGNDVTLPFRIAAWAKHLRLDVLHARGWPTLVETALGGALAGVRRTAYGFHGKTMDELGPKSLRRRLAEMIIPRLYSEVVTLTETMKAEVTRECRLDANRVRVIPNGVDTDVFRPTHRRRELRAEFGLPADDLIVGCVARLDRVKNHTVILRALSRLRSTGVNTLLLLVGAGPERVRLERQVQDSGLTTQVRWVGQSERVADVMNCMDIYVQPSLYEGFSNTLLEAMACGLPVLATRTGGTVDLLRDGEEGFLFEPDDDATLASLVLALTHPDRRRAMGLRARRHATDSFPLARMVQGYESLYRDLGSRRRPERTPGPSHLERSTV